ncbi:hypothetical protein R6Q59_013244 [Mikania micrantha]
MKLYLIFIVFLLSSLYTYEAQGTNRKLMTKIASFTATTTYSKDPNNEEDKNDPKSEIKSANGPIAYKDNFMFNLLPESFQHEANGPYPNDIYVVDYTPARQKSPIHN